MKKNRILYSLLLLFIFQNALAQGGMEYAHVRMINASVQASVDSRLPALAIKPELDLKLLNGNLELGGLYNIAIANLESWYQGEILDPRNSLVGPEINSPYSSYEIWAGGNFFNQYNPNATIVTVRSLGAWSISSSNPGSRLIQIGGRAGMGSINSKTNIYDHGFNIKGSDGIVHSESSLTTIYDKDTYANTRIRYAFAGLHLYNVSKKDEDTDKVRGGTQLKYYADLIIPTQVNIDEMFSSAGKRFEAVPKDGDDWKRIGYRAGVKRVGTGTVSSSFKIELGKMTTFSSVNSGPQSWYFMVGLGLGISPKVSAYDIN